MTTLVTIRELVRCMWYHELCGTGQPEALLDPQNAPKSLAAGASPQTPIGELTALPRPLAGFKGSYF